MKNNMMNEIVVELESICPLKMDKWTGEEKQPKTKEGYIKQAELKAYTNESGELIIPANAIKACIRNAANELAGVKKGKALRQTVRAELFIEEDFKLGRKKHDGICSDVVTRQGSGDKVTRVVAYRPMIKEWSSEGKIFYMKNGGLTQDFIKQALELGGLKYGLLGHRPEFGRFIVKEFKENGH